MSSEVDKQSAHVIQLYVELYRIPDDQFWRKNTKKLSQSNTANSKIHKAWLITIFYRENEAE